MSVVWVTQEGEHATEPSVLAYWILLRAWEHQDAAVEYDAVIEQLRPRFRSVVSVGAQSAIESDAALIYGGVEPWCGRWAGISKPIIAQAAIEVVLRLVERPGRKVTRYDLESIFGVVDARWDLLVHQARNRHERAARVAAEEEVRKLNFTTRQERYLAKWSDYLFRVRILKQKRVQVFAELEGMSKRNFLDRLQPWDAAAGYIREPKGGRHRNGETLRERQQRLEPVSKVRQK